MKPCDKNCANCNNFRRFEANDENGNTIIKNICWSNCTKRVLEYGYECNRCSNDEYDAATSVNVCRACGSKIDCIVGYVRDINKPYSMLFCSDKCYNDYVTFINNNITNVKKLINDHQQVILDIQQKVDNLSFTKLSTNRQSTLLTKVSKSRNLIEHYNKTLEDLEFLKMFYEKLKGNEVSI